MTRRTARHAAWALGLCAAACAQGAAPTATVPLAPPRASGRPDLGLEPQALYARWRQSRPAQLKLRHQVETRFAGRQEVIEGQLVLLAPDRFRVRASTPFGGTLFDVKTEPGGTLRVDVRVAELERQQAPQYLARDIKRIYLVECPAGTPAARLEGLVAVRCSLPPGEAIALPGERGGGLDRADDAVTLWLDGSAALVRKTFERDGKPTAVVDYDQLRDQTGATIAGRIVLVHQQVDYRLTIQLLDADPGIDAARLLAVD